MRNSRIVEMLFIAFLFGCQSSNKNDIAEQDVRQCDCPVENLPEEKIYFDSTVTKVLEDDLFDWSIGGNISSKIRKVIDAEVQARLSSNENNYVISTKKILEKINNDSPQLINKAYSFKLSRVFYCAYYSLLCQDTTISDNQLRIKSLEKLEEFRLETFKIIKEQSGVILENNTSKNNSSILEINNNSIVGNGNKQGNKKIETQLYIETQTGGSNFVINPKVDAPKPRLELLESKNNNEIETRSDSAKVYKNLIRVKFIAPFAVSSFDFRVKDDSVFNITPKASFITTHDTHRFKESGKFAFIRFINPQSGIYDLEVVSTKPIKNILNHFEGHWNNEFYRFDKE